MSSTSLRNPCKGRRRGGGVGDTRRGHVAYSSHADVDASSETQQPRIAACGCVARRHVLINYDEAGDRGRRAVRLAAVAVEGLVTQREFEAAAVSPEPRGFQRSLERSGVLAQKVEGFRRSAVKWVVTWPLASTLICTSIRPSSGGSSRI